MVDIIHVDADGKELSRAVKGKGAPLKRATRDAEGNYIVSPKVEKAKVFYIDLDESGNESSRKLKGQGRTSPGYIKHEEGPLAGHWVKMETKEETVSA
jgi:hypothetical protein